MYHDCEIILIGLSKGGVVVARYVTTICDKRIKKVITISSPLHGTIMTELLPKDSLIHRDIGYLSELVRNTAAAITQCSVPIYHIVPRWDHIIIRSTDSDNIYHYTGFYSHMGITHSHEIAHVIIKWLS